MPSNSEQFIEFAIAQKVLCFGAYTTKAGRQSPYFFNAGLFNDGLSLKKLGEFYARAILESDIAFDMLFGPAYKGISLTTATAIALAGQGHNVPYAFNRKEAKDHGEGGMIVGAPLQGRVLIIDDVISSGTSINESVETIRSRQATACGTVIALDRQERGQGALSAVQEVRQRYQFPVISIACLDDLIAWLHHAPELVTFQRAIKAYRQQYGTLATSFPEH